MKTFTGDSLAGFYLEDSEIQELQDKYEKEISTICEKFVKDCYEKNVEVCSAAGWFLTKVDNTLMDSRVKLYMKINDLTFKEL